METYSVDNYQSIKTIAMDEVYNYPGYEVLEVIDRRVEICGGHGYAFTEKVCVIGLPKLKSVPAK